MVLRHFTSSFSNLIKKRLFFATGVGSCATNTAVMVSSKRPSSKAQLEFLSPFLNTSVKEFLDPEEINQLHKLCRPVDDFKNTYVFVSDEKIAKDIVKNILRKSNEEKQIVVEANPGLGLITINLINSGVKQINIFKNLAFQKFPSYQILNKYFTAITENRVLLQNYHNANLVFNLFKFNQVQESPIKFVGTFTNSFFLRSLVLNFINDFLEDKELEIYLITSFELYQSLKVFSGRRFKYTQYCVLNLFFYVEELASYPRSGFLPPSKKQNGNMYLVKLTRNSNFLKNFQNTELKEYLIFITLLGGKKKCIIETLEKWLPNCGPYLISKGVSMLNIIHDFSPQESFLLFQMFQKCKGYNDFRNCVLQLY